MRDFSSDSSLWHTLHFMWGKCVRSVPHALFPMSSSASVRYAGGFRRVFLPPVDGSLTQMATIASHSCDDKRNILLYLMLASSMRDNDASIATRAVRYHCTVLWTYNWSGSWNGAVQVGSMSRFYTGMRPTGVPKHTNWWRIAQKRGIGYRTSQKILYVDCYRKATVNVPQATFTAICFSDHCYALFNLHFNFESSSS